MYDSPKDRAVKECTCSITVVALASTNSVTFSTPRDLTTTMKACLP